MCHSTCCLPHGVTCCCGVRPLPAGWKASAGWKKLLLGRKGVSAEQIEAKKLTDILWPDGNCPPDIEQYQFVFLFRTVLGAFVQTGASTDKQLKEPSKSVFASYAGRRELNFIPGSKPPTHYHSEIAEVKHAGARDTHSERGGCSLRFREMIVFRPTLVYPEYLVAYKRTNR